MEYSIVTKTCCGGICASLVNEQRTVYKEYASDKFAMAYNRTASGSFEEKVAEWEGKVDALRNLLVKLVKLELYSREESYQEMRNWLYYNPNPDLKAKELVINPSFMRATKNIYVPQES